MSVLTYGSNYPEGANEHPFAPWNHDGPVGVPALGPRPQPPYKPATGPYRSKCCDVLSEPKERLCSKCERYCDTFIASNGKDVYMSLEALKQGLALQAKENAFQLSR